MKKILVNNAEALLDGGERIRFETAADFVGTDSLTVKMISTFGAVKEFIYPIKRVVK